MLQWPETRIGEERTLMCKSCSDLGTTRLSRRNLVPMGAASADAFGLAVAGRGWIGSEALTATPTAGGQHDRVKPRQ
jgi:hypothetical protein